MMLSTFAKRTAKNSTSSTNNSFIKNRLYFTKTKPTLFAHHAERGTSFEADDIVKRLESIYLLLTSTRKTFRIKSNGGKNEHS